MALDIKEENRIMEEVSQLFQDLVKDLQRNDGTLRRFLRARNHNLNDAETMLRNSMEWRQANNVDTALHWTAKDIILEKFPIEYPGLDHEGRAVMYCPLGSWPIRQMVEAGYKDDLTQRTYSVLETLTNEIKKSGKDKFTLIVDQAEGTPWKFAHYETLQVIFQLFRDFEAHYPERLAEAYVINCPFYLIHVWYLIKPFLSGNTIDKVTFLSGGENKFMPKLLEKIPAESMPSRLRKSL